MKLKTIKLTDEQYDSLVFLLSRDTTSYSLKEYSEGHFQNLPKAIQNDLIKTKSEDSLFQEVETLESIFKKIWIYCSRFGTHDYYYRAESVIGRDLINLLNKNLNLAAELYQEFFSRKPAKFKHKETYMRKLIAESLLHSNSAYSEKALAYFLKGSKYGKAYYKRDAIRRYLEAKNLKKDVPILSRIANCPNQHIARLAIEYADKSVLPYLIDVQNPSAKKLLENRLIHG